MSGDVQTVLPEHRDAATQARCRICGGGEAPLYEAVAVAPDQTVAIVQCGECRAARREPPLVFPFEELPADAYMDDWSKLELSGLSFLHLQFDRAARELAPWLVKDANWQREMLDVGCGAGYLAAHFRAFGWKVSGVEPWTALAAWAEKYLKIPVEIGRIETLATTDPGVELVTAIDVISFVEDPVRFLAACRARLKPGGLLMLTTQNFDCEGRRAAGGRWQNMSANVRNWFFDAASLRAAARSAGFGTVKVLSLGGPAGDQELFVFAQNPFATALRWPDIADEGVDDASLPPLDRRVAPHALDAEQLHWREHGFLELRGFLPESLVDRYCAVRERLDDPAGWDDETPYMEIPEIRDLCLYPPLMAKLEHLIGEPMVMNLNLTGWRTTQRDWHQDDYLNPDHVRGHYLACWMALGEVDEECGPFQFVPASHRWPHVKNSKIRALLPAEVRDDRSWPIHSERLLTPFFEAELARGDNPIRSFTASKGDVLIWHARLLHRGTVARDPKRERRALICHYTALDSIIPQGPVERWDNGGLYYADPRKRPVDPRRRIGPGASRRWWRKLLG